MKFISFSKLHVLGISLLLGLATCVPGEPWPSLQRECANGLKSNVSIGALKDFFPEGLHFIEEDYVVEGYVISSDRAGNFFNTLILQDNIKDPAAGMAITMDLLESHAHFPPGLKIIISLKGLYIRSRKGVLTVGGARYSFGKLVLSNIPALRLRDKVFSTCSSVEIIAPHSVPLHSLNDQYIQQLITIPEVQIIADQLGLPMAESRVSSERILVNCKDQKLVLRNSGFSDFAGNKVPESRGSVTGILTKNRNTYELIIRDMSDFRMEEERCALPPN